MPRLPTILVIGSQAISTMPVSSAVVIDRPLFSAGHFSAGFAVRAAQQCRPLLMSPGLLEARHELVILLAPLRLFAGRLGGEAPQGADDRSVHAACRGRDPRTRRLVHERHELVRESRHRAGDADAAHVRAAADAVDPAPLGHVALDPRPPAAQLDQALGRAVLGGEVALLVVAGPVTALVDGGAE